MAGNTIASSTTLGISAERLGVVRVTENRGEERGRLEGARLLLLCKQHLCPHPLFPSHSFALDKSGHVVNEREDRVHALVDNGECCQQVEPGNSAASRCAVSGETDFEEHQSVARSKVTSASHLNDKGGTNLTCKYGYPVCEYSDTLVVRHYGIACGICQRHKLRHDLFITASAVEAEERARQSCNWYREGRRDAYRQGRPIQLIGRDCYSGLMSRNLSM